MVLHCRLFSLNWFLSRLFGGFGLDWGTQSRQEPTQRKLDNAEALENSFDLKKCSGEDFPFSLE